MLVVSAVALWSIANLVESAQRVAHTHEVRATLGLVLSLVNESETSTRGYVITGEDQFLEPYRAALAKMPREVSALRALTADNPSQRRRMEILEPLIARKLSMGEDRVSVRKEKGFEAARHLVLSSQGTQVMEKIRSVVREMAEEENALLQQRKEAEEANARLATWVIACGAGLSLVITVLALLMINLDMAVQMHLEAEKMGLEAQVQKRTEEIARFNTGLKAEIAERKRTEQEHEKVIVQLREALAKITVLQGILPVCRICQKIRDDQGVWHVMETYMRAHSKATMLHSVCPDCVEHPRLP